jgi:hypothetical protein
MSSSTTRASDAGQRAHDRPVLLHALVFLDEDAEVTVGRADVCAPCTGAMACRSCSSSVSSTRAR